jgi:acyl carrier protein
MATKMQGRDEAALERSVRAQVIRLTGITDCNRDTNLIECGLTSLDCVRIMVALESEFDVYLPDEFLGYETFSSLGSLTRALSAVIDQPSEERM